ncbi:hypothetical protein HPB48_017641 [Haemaphysalis longicornis]|uniref:ATP-dependent DNA helicase n=1 Tax=Haemaphysalis longicornis TaxID=44386 RepID=A0A9J6FLZ2_HAELO|nr:hypothetical protein HPB48_017641 [Haemaphysalis longicornis]
MSATGTAAGNATCNASVNASVSAADSAAEKRAQQEEQEEEGAAPPPAVIVHPENEDADLNPSQYLVRLIKHASPCAAVRKRQDIIDGDEYYNLMRMTNAEQQELLREIIHRQTTPSAPPLRVFSGPAGCGKTFVLRLAMDLYNRYSKTGNNTTYNVFVICASTVKAAVAVGGVMWHAAFKLSQKTTGPNKDGGLSASELNNFRVAFHNLKCVIIENITEKAPLLLWLQGGPGKSGLFGQFLENGPLGIDAEGKLYNRSCSFQRFANVLYVDYPAGGGYSMIESGTVLSRSLMDVTNDLAIFLLQFYKLFKEAYSMPLYIVGESYGARAAISLAKRLRIQISENKHLHQVKSYRLSGVIL